MIGKLYFLFRTVKRAYLELLKCNLFAGRPKSIKIVDSLKGNLNF